MEFNNRVIIQYGQLNFSQNTRIKINLPISLNNRYYAIGISCSSQISVISVFERDYSSFYILGKQILEENSFTWISVSFSV